jgi:hypothetical protein
MPRGGFRKNAGRKGFYGEKTVAVKIPISRVDEVKAFLLQGTSNDSVTPSNKDIAACVQKLSEIEQVVARWEIRCTPERAKAARWEKATELLGEILKITRK